MKKLTFLRDFVITCVITFIVSVIVSYFYSLIAHDTGTVDWESSIRFTIIFGLIFPSIRAIDKKRNQG